MTVSRPAAGRIPAYVRATSALLAITGVLGGAHAASGLCSTDGVAVQVLGSGGPMHGGGRGSSAYLLWFAFEPMFVVDMGGDTPTALSRVGVKPGSIPALLLSHVHPDHVGGIPDYLWGEITGDRNAPLAVVGPPAADRFLDAPMLFGRLFGPDGAFPDLQSVMTGRPFPIRFTTADGPHTLVLDERGFRVTAMRVDHGRAPTLAFRVDGHGVRIVFAGDQRGIDPDFSSFASGADLLVLHAMATDAVKEHSLARVIAAPTDLGLLASRARAKSVVLSHLMQSSADATDRGVWSLSDLPAVTAGLRREYHGPLHVAADLQCFAVHAN